MSKENKICQDEINDIYEAFECFKARFLKDQKSIFSNNKIFTSKNLEKIIQGFVNNPDESDSSFDEKIKKQLKNEENVHELFAHIIWLWSLVASDMKQKSKQADVNKWLSDSNKIKENNKFFFNHGIMSTGQYHKTNKPAELIYIIRFLEKVLDEKTDDYVDIIKKGVDSSSEKEKVKIGTSSKKVAMYNILLHLIDPNNYSSIASFGHKERIVNFFASHFDITFDTDDLDNKFKIVWDKCNEEFGDNYPYEWNELYKDKPFNKLDFYHKELIILWKSEIILESKNMILHGAPGTGKTYSVESSIKNRLDFEKESDANKQFKLVQFHPSYSYEDFIDGVKPSGIDNNGNLKFELVNGEFKNMCIDAFKELVRFNNLTEDEKKNSKIKKFYFVADEVNRAELSRVFGELLLCLEEDKRLSLKDDKLIGTKIKTQSSSLWKKEHAVVILDSDEKIAQLDENREYILEDDKKYNFYFGVPENLYFIGTMNDIDKSVDSFDMALRRRFFWKHFACDYDVVYEKLQTEDNIDDYIKICKKLNQYITSEKGFNLGSSYELGHSYFMKISKINHTQINKLWDNHIASLLKEYLRSEFTENEIYEEIDKAKKIFKLEQK
jgi:5-methylcytosine-specific restriction endonuclease McrBC GTP-binding regulatory subunit McrB